MLIEEIVRTCVNESVAQAAVASIGRRFAGDVAEAATTNGMTIGGFTAQSVERFARQGDEGELRSVVAAMNNAQEPLLAGLHRILCATLRRDAASAYDRRPMINHVDGAMEGLRATREPEMIRQRRSVSKSEHENP